MAMPASEDGSAGDDRGERERDGEGDTAGEADDADPSGPAALIPAKGQAGGVGDRVVGEDGDTGEADGSSKVERRGEHDDRSGDDALGAHRKRAAFIDLREPTR